MPDTHRIAPGTKISLNDLSTSGKDFHNDRKQAEVEFEDLREQFARLQNCLYAEGKHKLLIVFQAMDAGGKDGTIRRVFQGVNPQGVRVSSFKAPSTIERAHDYLWRVHQQVPAKGMIRVFNRSHYEDVLVVRVDQLVPESEWRLRYDHINQFEKLLADTGTTILKFYLHISKHEQKERFQDRLDKPHKLWKFSMKDLDKRKQWEDYQEAYEEMLERCSTDYAPWYAIPADQKWYRNLAISRVIVNAIKQLNPQFPAPEVSNANVQID